ncbi:hypothetical protein DSO57_1039150 [Entomophthora muscae]|uniref:Uncharacterized protein n=1 Tax=Entomophthora muscae TaxID=34485 RepID=A0ACC2S0J3_9FUNG|nr:hypothetical protein DSO57_1039150 [Entomophthora muscae]
MEFWGKQVLYPGCQPPEGQTPNHQLHAKPGSTPARTCCHSPLLPRHHPPASQPAGGGQRTPHGGTVYPCQMGKSPNWEPPKGNFPKPKRRGNCCPNL